MNTKEGDALLKKWATTDNPKDKTLSRRFVETLLLGVSLVVMNLLGLCIYHQLLVLLYISLNVNTGTLVQMVRSK